MKRISLIIVLALVLCGNAHAQFSDYGVKLAAGVATIEDDLATKAPLFGFNAGGYINFTLQNNPTVLAEIFYLQTGLNLVRRGASFEEIFENENTLSIRTGYYHTWYVQLPILAGVHLELPIREAGHIVGVFVGPTINYGVFGKYSDRKVSPGMSTYHDNYDVNFNGSPDDRKLFNHINRLDIGAILGISYERGPFTFTLFMDHGFMATSEGEDIIRLLDQQTGAIAEDVNIKIPNGNNHSVMFGVSYKLGSLAK